MQTLLEEILAEHGAVIFNGDGYSEAWHAEAEKRGLGNLRTSVDALPILDDPEVKAIFEKYGVLSNRELHSRLEVYLELYCKSVAVEARTTVEMARTIIFPAAIRYQGELAATCASLMAVKYKFDTDTLDKMTGLVKELQDGIAAHRDGDGVERARRRCSSTPSTTATRCCRRCWRCARRPTSSKAWSPTTSGRSRPTRRCSSSSDACVLQSVEGSDHTHGGADEHLRSEAHSRTHGRHDERHGADRAWGIPLDHVSAAGRGIGPRREFGGE